MALHLKLKPKTLTLTHIRPFSSSTSPFPPPPPPPPPEDSNGGGQPRAPSPSSFASHFSDIKQGLKTPPSPHRRIPTEPPPPPRFTSASSLDIIRRHLVEFRLESPNSNPNPNPPSFQELFKNSVCVSANMRGPDPSENPDGGDILSNDSIREGLRKFRSSQMENTSTRSFPNNFNLKSVQESLRSPSVSSVDGLPEAISGRELREKNKGDEPRAAAGVYGETTEVLKEAGASKKVDCRVEEKETQDQMGEETQDQMGDLRESLVRLKEVGASKKVDSRLEEKETQDRIRDLTERIRKSFEEAGAIKKGNMTNRQANLTSSQVESQVKNNPRKQVRWTENMDQVLINGILELVLAGPKRTEKGFKAEEFTKVIDKVKEACHVSVNVDNVRDRLRTLKKECDDITELFKTSGFALDSRGRVSAAPFTWETYIKMKGKQCPRYNDLLTVFGNDAAIGDQAVSENDFLPMSEPVDDLEGENDVEETQPSHSTNSYQSVQEGPSQRRNRTKPMEDAALALAKIAKSSEMIAIAFDKQASQSYINGQTLLEKLKEMDVDQGDILDLMQVFEGDEKAAKFFLEITDVEFRRLWVHRKLGRDPFR